MFRSQRRGAFTLIELLVVVAIIALLLSILLPSLAGAREQGKRAKCLANLKNVANAVHSYSVEDKSERLYPEHPMMAYGGDYWAARAWNWYVYGGRSSVKPWDGRLVVSGSTAGGVWWLSDDQAARPSGAQDGRDWSARTRPLNRYVLSGGISESDQKKLEWYHCPSDTGFPNNQQIDDVPVGMYNIPMYDTVGNSYRGSLTGYLSAGSFHVTGGPAGKKASTIPAASRTILLGEPRFFNMIGRDTNPSGVPGSTRAIVDMVGWHKKAMFDNLMFADGSARYVRAEERKYPGQVQIRDYGLTGGTGNQLFARGSTYQLDTYPVPASLLYGSWETVYSSLGLTPGARAGWPWSTPLLGR